MAAPLAGLVLLTSLLVAAAPLAVTQVLDAALRDVLADAPDPARNITAVQITSIPPATGDDIFEFVAADGSELEAEFPASLQHIVRERRYVVDAPRFAVEDVSDAPTSVEGRVLRLRYQEGIEQQVRIVEGRAPESREPVAFTDPQTGQASDVVLVEFAGTRETLDQLGLDLGSRVMLRPDETDLLFGDVPLARLDFVVLAEVTGIIELTPADDPYWFGDRALHRAEEAERIFATGLMAPEAYEQLLTLTLTEGGYWRYSWRLIIDPKRVDARSVETLAADLRRLEQQYGSATFVAPNETGVTTGLTRLFDQYLAQRRIAAAVLAPVGIGLLAIILTVFAVLAASIAERRRPALMLLRGRGASPLQLGLAIAAEGLLIALPPVVVGYGMILALVAGRPTVWTAIAVVSIPVMATLLLLMASAPVLARETNLLGRRSVTVRKTSARRVVGEILVVVLAILGVVLLRRRGLVEDASGDMSGAFDPYLAAVPVLVGLAGGLVMLWLVPFPMRLLVWWGGRRRDLVVFIGARRVSRSAATARLPLLAILLAVSVAVFASIIQTSINDALDSQSDQTMIVSRDVEAHALQDDPIIAGVLRGFRVTILLGSLYAALAAVATMALTAHDRARDFGYLRTVGMSSAQAVAVALVEQLPPVVLASLAGGVLGIGVAVLMEPGLGLDQLVVDGSALPLVVDWMAIIPIAGGVTLVVVLATMIVTYLTRRANPGAVLRLGD